MARRRDAAAATAAAPKDPQESATAAHAPAAVASAPPKNPQFLLFCRVLSVALNGVNDCDEVFNYWEPVHELLYGYGFQTWEYSPEYGLRSYAFVGLYAALAKVASYLYADRTVLFYSVRMAMALFSAACETAFYSAVAEQQDALTGTLLLLFMAIAPGFFVASTSMLPSSFCMPLIMLAYAGWIRAAAARSRRASLSGQTQAVAAVGLASLLGWPFAGALGMPIALDLLVVRGEWWHFIRTAILAGGGILLPMAAIDFHYYGKAILAPVSIVLYNVLSGDGRGPELYGVEPWTYYVKNGLLNLNVAFPLALLAIPVLLVAHRRLGTPVTPTLLLQLSGLYLWLGVFFLQPHKEERFLYVVYPLFCWHAALVLRLLLALLPLPTGPGASSSTARNVVLVGLMAGFIALSLSRIAALVFNYHGALDLYREMALGTLPVDPKKAEQRLCVGKEWHRFPSHFFLPPNVRVGFLRSDFRGLLPKYYEGAPHAGGTRVIPSGMNDLNREDPTRYVEPATCDWVVDTCLPTQREPCWDVLPPDEHGVVWRALRCHQYLDAAASPSWARAFYVPVLSDRHNVQGLYCLFAREVQLPSAEDA